MLPAALPSNLELQALSVLWDRGPSTVATILDALPDGKDRAYTTVLSVMQNLERKRLVLRQRAGRAHVYRPAQPQQQIVGSATRDFVTNAFGGRIGDAVLAILSAGDITPEEKTNIERELERHTAMAAKKATKKAPAKKAAKKAPAKKAPAKKAAKKPAKKAAKKAAKSAKKAAKKAPAKKTVKKAAKKAAKKAPKKAAKKAPAKKAAKKVAKKAAKKAKK